MKSIYHNSLSQNTHQLLILPLLLFNVTGFAPFLDMVKNNNYSNYPFTLFFIILFILILLLLPQKIIITPKYIIRKYTFIPFLKRIIHTHNITQIHYFPNYINQNFSSITIKTNTKDIAINIGNYYVSSSSEPELQHAGIAQAISYITHLDIKKEATPNRVVQGYFYQNVSTKPTLKNSRYRFVLACGLLTVLSAIFLLSGKAYFPALKFDDHLIFIFSIFTISALIAFLLIKENPKDEYVSNHFTAILFGLMMTLTAYSFIINYTAMYGQVKLVRYELMQNTENNQEWHPINSNDSPIISTPYQSKKPLHSKQEIQIYTGLLGIQTTTFQEYRKLMNDRD